MTTDGCLHQKENTSQQKCIFDTMGPEEVDEWERMGNFLLFYVQLVRVLPLISNFQFSFFFSRTTGALELSENLFGTLQSARGKKKLSFLEFEKGSFKWNEGQIAMSLQKIFVCTLIKRLIGIGHVV